MWKSKSHLLLAGVVKGLRIARIVNKGKVDPVHVLHGSMDEPSKVYSCGVRKVSSLDRALDD